MHPAERQAALKKRKITQKQIAQDLGKSEMTISGVINGTRISDPIMRYISEKMGLDHTKVFPEYYLAAPKRSTSKAVGQN